MMNACKMQTILTKLWGWTNLVLRWDNYLDHLSLLILVEFFGASVLSLKASSKPWRINHWISSLTQFIEEIESYGLEFHLIDVEIEFNGLNLAYQNRVYRTRDVSFLNSFKNALTNEIVWKIVLFKKKKSQIFPLKW